MDLLGYYSRKDVLKEMLNLAKDREVQVWFGKMPGRRPEIVGFEGDILEMVKRGMTSFHVSVERWINPLDLKPGMLKKDLDSNRKGWDLLLDLDSKWLESSYYTAVLLIDALKFYDIKSYGVKFTGGHGFHIVVPFEAFPFEVKGVSIKNYFPDGLRVIVEYLKSMIKEYLSEKIVSKGLDYVALQVGKKKEEFMVKGVFDPYTIVDIDSVLISSRHLFRAVYSLNEKKGLVSVPLNDIKDFKLDSYKEDFRPCNVKVGFEFLKKVENKGEATALLVAAFDWWTSVKKKKSHIIIREKEKVVKDYSDRPKVEVGSEYFPPCIQGLFKGVESDGRKRAVFVLINFLRSVNWGWDRIEEKLKEVNSKSYEPLKEGYVVSQLNWSKRQGKIILPPNCANKSYYVSMGLCSKKDGICFKIKNPVNYAFWRFKVTNRKKRVRTSVKG